MQPFADIPYGLPPTYAYPLFESLMYLVFLVCLRYAVSRGASHVAYLIGGLLFGLLLEYVNVVANMGYVYGRFTIMFGTAPKDIPLCIGVGWGIIMYTARLFSDGLKLPLWVAVATDTLLAISIDLGMDTVAYRMHMWHWNWVGTGKNPLTADWFGIPFGNFFGWICVVFLYSSISRLLERRMLLNAATWRIIIIPFLSILCSQIVLFVTLKYINAFLKESFGITSMHRFVVAMVLLSFFVGRYVLIHRPRFGQKPPFVTWLVPAFAHSYFLAFLFTGEYYRENVWMMVVAIVLAAISVLIHVFPYFKTRTTRPGVVDIHPQV